MTNSRSREGAWIEIQKNLKKVIDKYVAPVRERGLKYYKAKKDKKNLKVAPVRERGLKLFVVAYSLFS